MIGVGRGCIGRSGSNVGVRVGAILIGVGMIGIGMIESFSLASLIPILSSIQMKSIISRR